MSNDTIDIVPAATHKKAGANGYKLLASAFIKLWYYDGQPYCDKYVLELMFSVSGTCPLTP